MYEPKFNSVLVEIEQDEWGGGNDESMLGKSFNKGTVVSVDTELIETVNYPLQPEERIVIADILAKFKGKQIIWNEGAEAGTTFEYDGKLYGFIYWYDIRASK